MLSLAFSRHPSIHFRLTTMVKTKHAKRKKRRYGGGEENRGRGRVLFSHPFNNGGMISAYPLISSRLFSPLLRPFCHVSHSATPRCGGRKGSLFLSLASLFFVTSPSVCPSSAHSIPLSSPEKGFWCWLWSFFLFSIFFFLAFHLFPLSQTSKISPNKKVVGAYRGLASFTYLVTKMHEKLIWLIKYMQI